MANQTSKVPAELAELQILRPRVAAKLAGVDKSTLYRLVKRGELPPPRRISTRVVGWPAHEIRQLIEGAA